MIRVVVIDDSGFMRRKITGILEKSASIVVVGEARDPYEARSVIRAERPDVLTLDIEMPRMDGLTFLKKLVEHHPIPVVVCSSLARDDSAVAVEAMRSGAVEVVAKPKSGMDGKEFKVDLVQAVQAASMVRKGPNQGQIARPKMAVRNGTGGKVICMGASTGGAVVVEEILASLPANCPPIVVAQHLPADFNRSYAANLDKRCAMKVREARNGDVPEPGLVLLAPGEQHMVFSSHRGRAVCALKQGPRVNQHRPSVDVLFRSAAQRLGSNAVGVILTGMGNDGARGLLAMRKAGATTIAQGLTSCAVAGMPQAAKKLGAVEREVELKDLPDAILQAAGSRSVRGAA